MNTLQQMKHGTHTLQQMKHDTHESANTLNNQEFITTYLAVNGPRSRAEIRRELTMWRQVPNHWYKAYFYDSDGNIGFDVINDECVLTGKGIRQALKVSKRTGIQLDLDVLFGQLARHLEHVVHDPLTMAALKTGLRPERLLELVEWDITNNIQQHSRRYRLVR